MVLRLPAPVVLVLLGASSAGKTTWALEHFAPNEVLSSDALRAMVGIDGDDQTAGTFAFDLLEKILEERSGRHLTTVVDTTGLSAESRRRWIETAHAARLPVHAIVFDTSPAACQARNAERDRPLPKSVLTRQLSALKRALAEIEDEGFDGVHRERPIAVVPPPVASAAQIPAEPATSSGHTFGLMISRFDWPDGDRGRQIAEIAQRAERAGFRDIWLMDHFRQIPQVGRPWEDILEVYTTLGYLAAGTERVRLGAMVSGITHRHPVILGKMIATLDALSAGRAVCGLGAGWDRAEHEGYGIPFPDLSDRYALLQDTLEMLPLLWGKGSPAFDGRLLHAKELTCYPRPVQERIPIVVGGGGERTTLRLAARHGDGANVLGDTATVARKAEVLERHCADIRRDPSEIELSHLISVTVAESRAALRDKVDRLRDRSTSREEFGARNNAGTVDDLAALFSAYHDAGARHSIISMPDVANDGSIEIFAEVIAALGGP